VQVGGSRRGTIHRASGGFLDHLCPRILLGVRGARGAVARQQEDHGVQSIVLFGFCCLSFVLWILYRGVYVLQDMQTSLIQKSIQVSRPS